LGQDLPNKFKFKTIYFYSSGIFSVMYEPPAGVLMAGMTIMTCGKPANQAAIVSRILGKPREVYAVVM
jgi:hypothetical protein